MVYATGSEGRVFAVDGATGKQAWAITLSAFGLSDPAIGGDGTVYVGSLDANVYAIGP
jgi:outer membrane protein assembly factor BamB